MIRKVQNTIGEYGRSLAGNALSPRISPSQLWVRMRLPKCGICSVYRVTSAFMSGRPTRLSAVPPFSVSQALYRRDLGRLIFAGVRPCASPTKIWIGVSKSRIHSAIEKLRLTGRHAGHATDATPRTRRQ